MSAAFAVPPTDKLTGGKAFARSLNILLKHVRLYGLAHKRSTEQFDQAWDLLQQAISGETGLLLAVTDGKILIDGVPIEAGPSEQAFAKMLAGAGIASIQFSPTVTPNDFQSVVASFATSRPSELLGNLQAICLNSPTQGIKVNEVRFVPHDSVNLDTTMASLISSKTITELGPQVTDWIKDPKKLLQLISAAEGKKGGNGTSEGGGSGDGSLELEVVPAYENRPAPLEQDEVVSVIRFMSRLGMMKSRSATPPTPTAIAESMAELSPNAHSALYQMLFNTVTSSFDGQETPDLAKLAEHLAIRFAVESFERGDVKINSVQQMIDRLNGELESLRKVLNSHEDRMTRAGLVVESQVEVLDRQFWAAVPDWGKKNVLLSDDGWCIPPRNVRSFVEQLMARKDRDTATAILHKCVLGIEKSDPEARKKIAIGLTELADLFAQVEPRLLPQAIKKVGQQLTLEQSLDSQTLLSAAFVRLSQEASAKRDYTALESSLRTLAHVEESLPNLARDIRPRVSVQSRMREFVAEVQENEKLPQGLVEVLQRTPGPAADEIATQFTKCGTRAQAERYLELMYNIGTEGYAHLREKFLKGSPAESVIGVGILTRMDLDLMLNELPARVSGWSRQQQDSAVRQVAASGSESRGELLLSILEQLDPLIIPEALDEIGLSGNAGDASAVLDLAAGDGCAKASHFVQLKAVEAVGRLRVADAKDLLTELVMIRTLLGFANPRELRVAAMQALQSIDCERARQYLAKSGLEQQELSVRPLDAANSNWVRQRRYERVVPNSTIMATAVTSKGRTPVALERISLGGGLAMRNGRGQFGSEALLEMQLGMRHLKSRVLIRESQNGVMFEIADIGMDERNRLRKLVASQKRPVATA